MRTKNRQALKERITGAAASVKKSYNPNPYAVIIGSCEPQAPIEERRNARRESKYYPCQVVSGQAIQTALLKNLSATGAMLVGVGIDNFAADTARLRCAFAGNRDIRIVWRDLDCIGVEFMDETADE